MSEEKTPKMQRLNIDVDEYLHSDLKIEAALKKKSMKDFVTELIRAAVPEHTPRPKKKD